MKNNKFYTVTVFEGDENISLRDPLPKYKGRKHVHNAYSSKRIMFIYDKKINCTNIVRYNRSDIHEQLYGYCIIEEYKKGCVYGNFSNLVSLWKWETKEYKILKNGNAFAEGCWNKISVPSKWIGSFSNFALDC